MTTEETNRREFEEWALFQDEFAKFYLNNGKYQNIFTQLQWEAWQAAREQVTEQRDRLAEAVNAATILIAAKGRHNTSWLITGYAKPSNP
jgi:hypothetical protein